MVSKTGYLCDWSVAEADWLNHHHVKLHLRLCGLDYLAGQNDPRVIVMMLKHLDESDEDLYDDNE